MKSNYFRLIWFSALVCFFASTISGCVFIIGGAVGLAGGYAISSDTVEGMIDKNYEDVWEASSKVANIMGSTKFKDRQKGFIESEVGKSKVNINLERVTEETTRIRIKARRYYKLMPDIALAQNIYTKILQETK